MTQMNSEEKLLELIDEDKLCDMILCLYKKVYENIEDDIISKLTVNNCLFSNRLLALEMNIKNMRKNSFHLKYGYNNDDIQQLVDNLLKQNELTSIELDFLFEMVYFGALPSKDDLYKIFEKI